MSEVEVKTKKAKIIDRYCRKKKNYAAKINSTSPKEFSPAQKESISANNLIVNISDLGPNVKNRKLKKLKK